MPHALVADEVKAEGERVPWPKPASSTMATVKTGLLVETVRVESDCWILYQATVGSLTRVWPRSRVPLLAGSNAVAVPLSVT